MNSQIETTDAIAKFVLRRQPLVAGIDCVAWTSDVLPNPYGEASARRLRQGVKVRTGAGSAIFRCTMAKDCDITTFMRRLSTKRTESFFIRILIVPLKRDAGRDFL